MAVTDLEPGEVRTMYKNLSIDMRRYKNLKMFLHAESPGVTNVAGDDDLSTIVRFGTDLEDNYYEVEMPLKISTVLTNPSPLQAWPEENNLDLTLQDLIALKLTRDSMDDPGLLNTFPNPNDATPLNDDGLILRIKGSPTLAQIKTVMLGVKNNSTTAKTAEIWFNELRAVGFDNDGGWAGVVSANANFADVADVSLTGSLSTVGFGSVESRVQERSLEDTRDYNVCLLYTSPSPRDS